MPTLKTRILVPALAVALMAGTTAAPAAATPVASKHAQHGHGHGKDPQERIEKNVTIKRDNYGVPHVYAKTIGGLS